MADWALVLAFGLPVLAVVPILGWICGWLFERGWSRGRLRAGQRSRALPFYTRPMLVRSAASDEADAGSDAGTEALSAEFLRAMGASMRLRLVSPTDSDEPGQTAPEPGRVAPRAAVPGRLAKLRPSARVASAASCSDAARAWAIPRLTTGTAQTRPNHLREGNLIKVEFGAAANQVRERVL